jgi:hypothetical protein
MREKRAACGGIRLANPDGQRDRGQRQHQRSGIRRQNSERASHVFFLGLERDSEPEAASALSGNRFSEKIML